MQGLSSRLLQSPKAKPYPDVITFGYWCRKASLLKMKREYELEPLRLGRGTVFHITPSNVPVNFAYSLAAGLLAGNANIVRIPTRRFPQVRLICETLCELLGTPEFSSLTDHLSLLRYEHDESITAYFSQHADVRIIWGGDATISEIRRTPLPPRSFDLTFPDRYSLCAINADEYPGGKKAECLALDFYNDTYLFDQNACTSPHLVVWIGSDEKIAEAKKRFWAELHKVVKGRYVLQPVLAVDKYVAACELAIAQDGTRMENMPDNLIVRMTVGRLPEKLVEFRGNAGYFIEYTADSLDEIAKISTRQYQTLSYFGFPSSTLRALLLKNRSYGIDRIVPIGETTVFSLVWDGYDLIKMLSRACVVL